MMKKISYPFKNRCHKFSMTNKKVSQTQLFEHPNETIWHELCKRVLWFTNNTNQQMLILQKGTEKSIDLYHSLYEKKCFWFSLLMKKICVCARTCVIGPSANQKLTISRCLVSFAAVSSLFVCLSLLSLSVCLYVRLSRFVCSFSLSVSLL